MDHKIDLFEFEPDDLQQIAGRIGPDCEHLGRVGVWFEIKKALARSSVANGCFVDAMLVGRTVDLHIKTIL